MTDPLRDLLHREVDDLQVPPVPTATVLVRGRARRRRRHLAVAGGVVGACLAVTAVAVGVDALPHDSDRVAHRDVGVSATSQAATTYQGATFAIRNTVFLDGGRLQLQQVGSVRSLLYTSAGVVARQDYDLLLVTPDGLTRRLSAQIGTAVPSTDPHQPYLSWAEVRDGEIHVVVLDVRSDQVVADRPVLGAPRSSGGTPPVVSLSGDLVYVGTDDLLRVVNWRTGAVTSVSVVPPGAVVRGGVTVVERGGHPAVVTAETGAVLLLPGGGPIGLSPDGRYATSRGAGESGGGASTVTVHDLGTNATEVVDVGQPWGWGPDDTIFSVGSDFVRTCSPVTGRCRSTPLRLDPFSPSDLHLGGLGGPVDVS